MAKRVFTVISTSGEQGDGWGFRGEFETRKAALEHAIEIAQPDARSNDYITAVIGKTELCPDHYPVCRIGDTRRVLTSEQHLKSLRCHITDMSAVE